MEKPKVALIYPAEDLVLKFKGKSIAWPVLIFAVLVALLMFGCSGVKAYKDSSPDNISISTQAQEDWVMHRLSIELNIYAMSRDCTRKYKGTRLLNNPHTGVGIPERELTYLEFVYIKYPVLTGTTYVSKQGTLFRAGSGMEYEIDVNFDNGAQNIRIAERNVATGHVEVIPFVPVAKCHQGLLESR